MRTVRRASATDIAAVAQRHVLHRRYWAVVGNGANSIAGARDPDQALGALLQGDRVRRHRGQEAHRPVLGAADPRVRGRARPARTPTTSARRSRSTAPTAPRRSSSPTRHEPVSRRARDDHRARGAPATSTSCSRTVAGHLFGYEAALAIDASARPLREARAASKRAARPRRARRAARPARAAPRRSRRAASSTACAPAATTARSRPAPRRGSRRCCGTRPGTLPLDSYEIEHGKVGTPSTVVEDLTAALTKAHRGAHAPGRRHQAPGQDRHRRHLPLRRDAAPGAARARGARRRRAARRPQLPRAAHARRPRPRGRRGRRLHALPDRGRPRADARDDPRRRPGRRRAAASRRAPTIDPALRGTKHRVATAARGHRGARAPRRSHARDRARGQAQPDHRPHAAARPLRRPPPARRDARRAPGLPGPLRRARRTRSPRPSRRSTTPCSRTIPVVDLLTEPVYVLAERWRSLT